MLETAFCILWSVFVGMALAAVHYRGICRRYRRALLRARRHRVFRVRQVLASADIHIGPASVRTDMTVSVQLLETLANGVGRTLMPLQSLEKH